MAKTMRKSRALLTRRPARIKIKVLLAERDLTQTELARNLGISLHNLNALLNGRKLVHPENQLVRKIADYFDKPVDELFPIIDLAAIEPIPPILDT